MGSSPVAVTKYIIVFVYKSASNSSFNCKKIYVSTILNEIGLNGTPNTTCGFSRKRKVKWFMKLFLFLGWNSDGKDKSLPIKYYTPKMHKEAIGTRFIVIWKRCSKNLISKRVSKAFQVIFHQIQSFYYKSYFYFSFKHFWTIENSKHIPRKFENINCKAISRFDFATLHPNYLIFDLVCWYNWIHISGS